MSERHIKPDIVIIQNTILTSLTSQNKLMITLNVRIAL